MGLIIKIAQQSSFFLLGNVFTLVVGFVFQVYLASILGAEGLGTFGLIESSIAIVMALLSIGIPQTVLRFLPAHLRKGETAMAKTLLKKSLQYLLFMGIAGLLLTGFLAPLITKHVPLLSGYESEIRWMALMIPIGLLIFCCAQILRGFMDIRYFVIANSFVRLIVKVGVTVLLFYIGFDLIGYVWAVVISSTVALIWLLFGISKYARALPEEQGQFRTIPVEWRAYAKVMYGNSMVLFWADPLQRFAAAAFVGNSAVGVLMITQTLFSLPATFVQMFLSIVSPMLSAAHASDNKDEVVHLYHLTTDWLVRLSFPLLLFLAFFANDVLLYFGEEFAKEGTLLLRLLLVAQLVNTVCGPLGNVLNMCGLEKEKFRATIVSTILGTIILLVGANYAGLVGIGFGIASTILMGNAFSVLIAKRKMGLSWWDSRFSKWLIPMFVTTTVVMAANLLYSGVFNALWLIAFLVGIYVLFHGIYYLSGLHKDDEIIVGVLRRKLGFAKQ